MGGIISQLVYILHTVKSTFVQYNSIRRRVAVSPGIPILPSQQTQPPYWTIPASRIARHGELAELPEDDVDVVIIGSGITGTAIAKALLERAAEHVEGTDKQGTRRDMKIVMLEARDACSGSTGRNGGHIGPNIYNEYVPLREAFGAEAAQEILRFRLAHLPSLLSTARDEGLLFASQARTVEGYDVYKDPQMYEQAKTELQEFLKEMPTDVTRGFELIDDPKEIDKLQLSPSVLGCICKPGGAIHPYRFITGLLSNMLDKYKNFELFTRTPCEEVISSDTGYVVRTSKGGIRTRHVIHATNAWSSHLLPGMRGKIIHTRVSMTAQRPGKGLAKSWAGSRAFVFYPINGHSVFEYLTQLLPTPIKDDNEEFTPSLPTSGEFLFGGRIQPSFTRNIGVADDNSTVFENEAHLGGALERFFAPYWGEDGDERDSWTVESGVAQNQSLWGKGRVMAGWSGLLGMSADLQPWVGRVPCAASGRKEPRAADMGEDCRPKMAASGEWISAGYAGEGMVHAWLCGRALACMVLGSSPEECGERKVPHSFLISECRVRRARLEDTLALW